MQQLVSHLRSLGWLALCTCVLLSTAVAGDEKTTNSTPAGLDAELPPAVRDLFQQQERANLQLQEKLHSAMMAIEETRQEANESAKRNTDNIAARLALIEQSLTHQRDREAETLQRSNRAMLVIAGIFGAVGLLAMVFTAFFLLRTMNRLAQVTSAMPLVPALPGPPDQLLPTGEARLRPLALPAETGKLLGAIERLEHRIQELEETTEQPHVSTDIPQGGSANPTSPETTTVSGSAVAANGTDNQISLVLGKGQALLNLDQPENALMCFEQALAIEPSNPDALVKKGTALERLRRWEEALECYDRAIAANGSLTLAYLYKGGVYNQLERFGEALECYEQALRTQHKVA